MFQYIKSNIGNIANSAVVIGAILSAVLWSHSTLAKDIQEVKGDIKEIRGDIKVANARIDATNERIDHTYELILDILRDRKERRE